MKMIRLQTQPRMFIMLIFLIVVLVLVSVASVHADAKNFDYTGPTPNPLSANSGGSGSGSYGVTPTTACTSADLTADFSAKFVSGPQSTGFTFLFNPSSYTWLQGISDTKTVDFTVTVDSGVPSGTYTWKLVADATSPNMQACGESNGAQLTLTVTGASAEPLTVSKIATPAFTRTFTWGITKSVDNTEIDIASGGTPTFNYVVTVTHDSGTDTAWSVTGTITVNNPNVVDVTGVTVTDSINDLNAVCTVTDGSAVTIPSGSSTFSYSCSYSAAPTASTETNTATGTWSGQTLANGQALAAGSASGTASIDWSSVTPTLVDGSVTVTDTLGGTLGAVSYTDPSTTTFTYSHDFTGDTGGTCTSHDNTATFTPNTSGTTGSASKTVKVCVGLDLTASKTAIISATWSITKSASPILVEQIGGTATFTYTVVVTSNGWQVTGTITVTNPNDWEAITLTGVTDSVDNGGSCTTSFSTLVVPASGSISGTYLCTYASAPSASSGTNTATASWDKAAFFTPDDSATGTAAFAFSSVTVTDTLGGTLGSCTVLIPCTFTYINTVNVPQFDCVFYTNTATIVETGQTASQKVEVCGPAKTGALSMGFWQNKNGQGIITGGSLTSGVCKSGTWLRQYAPFQDLSATATCSQVATYVYNIIKAATASGPSMNAMLKAQMLATALDVYFSDPSLGGNKINAPAPIGSVSIDLTNIGSTHENTASAFGGTTPQTVLQLLNYAASRSNSGGSVWYGNVKATQQLAKDTFDAINNQVAFSP